jgi:hypothetical protein
VGPRAVLDSLVKRKIPSPRLELNPRTPIVQPVAQRYTDSAITALHVSSQEPKWGVSKNRVLRKIFVYRKQRESMKKMEKIT